MIPQHWTSGVIVQSDKLLSFRGILTGIAAYSWDGDEKYQEPKHGHVFLKRNDDEPVYQAQLLNNWFIDFHPFLRGSFTLHLIGEGEHNFLAARLQCT